MMFTQNYSKLKKIYEGKGYSLELRLKDDELSTIRNYIYSEALSLIKKFLPEEYETASNLGLNKLHLLSSQNKHNLIWSKKNRIFPESITNELTKMPFFKALEDYFGDLKIANEEKIYPQEIYWRFVRPNKDTDIGPLHADKWFWDLGHGELPEGYSRLKIWISIFCAPGGNGLRVVPNSHKKTFPYSYRVCDGIKKPMFNESTYDLNIINLDSTPGQCVIFHDNLLHGGCVNYGSTSRISLEFTMLIKNEILNFLNLETTK